MKDVHKQTMLKYSTVEEWAARHLRGELSQKFKDAFDSAHAKPVEKPARRRRRAASVEASD